jgi:hypothetical protein
MENHAKYADTIYSRGDGALYVNLFIPSELTWKEKGLVVRQETRFPEEDGTRLTLEPAAPLRLALKVRYPSWARSGITLTVNGRTEPVTATPGSYLTLDREWKRGDVVGVRLPMSLREEAMPDDPKTVALLYGPLVLAGELGREGLDDAVRYGPGVPPMRKVPPLEVPALVTDAGTLLASVKPAPGGPLRFRTEGVGRPHDVTLIPFYQAADERYTVYWKLYTRDEWTRQRAERDAAEKRRRTIADATVDLVNVDDPASESGHGYRGEAAEQWSFEGRKVRETRGGWFSYDLRVRPDRPMSLVFTYKGAEGRARRFDVLVDGERVATKTVEYHPTELLDAEYAIPEALTHGKERVTVRFQTAPDVSSASISEVRVVPTPGQP